MSDRKRPLDSGADAGIFKRLKSDNAADGPSSLNTADPDVIKRKRAEIEAKVAAMRAKSFGAGSSGGLPAPTKSSASPAPSKSPGGVPEDLARRVAEAKRRVSEAQMSVTVKGNPYMSMPQAAKNKPRVPEPESQGAGLKMAAHPLLLEQTAVHTQSKKDRYKPMQPKFASIKANVRNAPTPPPAPTPKPVVVSSNPYASTSVQDTGFEGAPKERAGRSMRFVPKGKYIAMGNQMRQDAKLEELKQRIAESARKAGLDNEGIEKSIKRPPPPESEWWDEALLPHKKYEDLAFGLESMYIRNTDSPITLYIQHPIPIPGPQEKSAIALKPMMLTKKELKKMRKLRRATDLQDKRDRIRMGLLPPDAPKVRLANLMKVLTSDAVQDPTRVEARVRREVAQRKHGHEKMNAERKLTDEQRREKIENKKQEEEKKGIFAAVYKVKNLSDPAHRFKVWKNADQNNLSGVCIFNKAFSMIYVEGAPKFMRKYKRLMLQRMVWTEASRPRGSEEVAIQQDPEAPATDTVAGSSSETAAVDEGSTDLTNNTCSMVWEGQIRDRAYNGFKSKACPTDGAAKEFLGEKMKGYWDMAKNWQDEEDGF